MLQRSICALFLLTLFSLTAPVKAQKVHQERGKDSRVDYADLTRFGPWDDRNYQLTQSDLKLLAPNEEELYLRVPAFFRVELRRENPEMPRDGEVQYPLSAWQIFRKRHGGYWIDGKVYRKSEIREGRYHVVMKDGIEVQEDDDIGQAVAKFLDDEVQVSFPAGSAESAVKIHPRNPDLVIAGANDVTVTQKMYRSADGGETWIASAALPRQSSTCCDPTVDWSSDGRFAYAAALSGSFQIWFYRSDDNGATWNDLGNAPVRVSDFSGNDKEFLHVDKSPHSNHQDNLYLTWHDNNNLRFARSVDFGATWTTPPMVISSTQAERGVGSDITTDRDGNVYYFWPATGTRRILMRRSSNGGASFAASRTVSTTNAGFNFPIPAMHNRKAAIIVSADADVSGGPFNNNVYVAWTDATALENENDANANHARIQVGRSTDGGNTWTVNTPHSTNDQNSVDRFHPALAVGPDGVVHLVYYDTRRDSSRKKVDLYYTSSDDGGSTWAFPSRLTSQQSPRINDNFQLGDYNGLDVVLNNLITVYTDNRNEGSGTNKDIYAIGIPAAGNCAFTNPGPKAIFRFDETSGTTAYNPYGSNGTLINGPQFVAGLAANGLNLDGSNDYVSAADSSTLEFGTDDFSISAWVKTQDSYGMIASKREYVGGFLTGYLFTVYNQRLLLQIGDTTGTTNYYSSSIPTFTDGDWHHVAVTVDRNSSSGGRFYIDGELVYTFNPTARQGNTNNSTALEIGRMSGGGFYLDGILDEVMLFRSSLPASAVREIYQASSNAYCTLPSVSFNCSGNYSGSYQVACLANASGGVPPYSYSWSYAGSADSWNSNLNYAEALFTRGSCGSGDVSVFSITVTDAAGQTRNSSTGPLSCF